MCNEPKLPVETRWHHPQATNEVTLKFLNNQQLFQDATYTDLHKIQTRISGEVLDF